MRVPGHLHLDRQPQPAKHDRDPYRDRERAVQPGQQKERAEAILEQGKAARGRSTNALALVEMLIVVFPWRAWFTSIVLLSRRRSIALSHVTGRREASG
jgi:hypothetical protein